MWSWLSVVLLFSFAWSFTYAIADKVLTIDLAGYNYEISKHVQDIVNQFLDGAQPPVLQTQNMFANGLETQQNPDRLNRLLFLQTKSAPHIAGLTIDFLDGTTHQVSTMFTPATMTLVNSTAPCDPPPATLTPHNFCFAEWTLDERGNRVQMSRLFNRDMTMYPSFQNAIKNNTTWTDIEVESLANLTLEFSAALRNTSGDIVGVASSLLRFPALDSLLLTTFANHQDERIVFVTTERLSLVAASIETETIVPDPENEGWFKPIKAYNSTDARIRSASTLLLGLPSIHDAHEVMFVHEGYLVQITPIKHHNIEWFAVVVRPANPRRNFMSTASTTFWGACVICAAMAILTLSFALWVSRFRSMKLWAYAQPKVLLSLLFGHTLGIAFAVVAVITPSTKLCTLRAWLGTFAVTWTAATVLGKVLHQRLLDSPLVSTYNATLQRALGATALAVAVQALLLVLQTALGVFSSKSFYSQSSGELILNDECEASTNKAQGFTLAVLQSLVLIGLCLPTCYLSFLSRNASQAYAESKGVFAVAVFTFFVVVAFVAIEIFGSITRGTVVVMLEVMIVVWYVATTQAIVFVPRIFRQLIAGDLTLAELRELIRKHSAGTKQRASASQSKGSAEQAKQAKQQGADYTAGWN